MAGWPTRRGGLVARRLGHKLDSCLDAEGSEEETAAFVHDYTEFLMHFPMENMKKKHVSFSRVSRQISKATNNEKANSRDF